MKNKLGRFAIVTLALSLCAIVYAQQQHTVLVGWTPGVCGTTPGCDATVSYNVFRSTSPTVGFVQLNTNPIVGTSYVDATAVNGVTYYYQVVAVDASGSFSAPSNTTGPIVIPGNPAPPTGCNAVVQVGAATNRPVFH